MSTFFNSAVVFGDQYSFATMNSVSSYENSNSSQDSSRESSATQSPMQFVKVDLHEMLTSCNISHTNYEPFLRIIEEPVDKFRFRYKSEMMGTHGSILARSHERNRRKKYPTVQLCNFNNPAIIRCSLYTANSNEKLRTPHTHRLIVRAENNMDKDDPHEMIASQDNDFTAVFHGMGIVHTAKRNIVDELMRKKRARLLEKLQLKNTHAFISTVQEAKLRQETEEEARKMNLNSVSLCFEAFTRDSNNCLHQICSPVFSKPINNMKSALTGELKICRIDKTVSTCMGGDEVFILVEKVGKKNIKVKFFEFDDDDNEIWCDYGRFTELDVHHQYAIVFRTPPYRDLEIDKAVDVFVQLYRPTDGDTSEPVRFQYKPSERIGRNRKRQRMFNESLQSGEQNLGLTNGVLNGGHMDVGIDLKNRHDSLMGTDNLSFTDLINNGGMNSDEFKEFIDNISLTDLNLPQTVSGSSGLIGTDILKPVKYDMEPVCTGTFVVNPSDLYFAGGLKTEGIIARDYIRTFDDQELACDGEEFSVVQHSEARFPRVQKSNEGYTKEKECPIVKIQMGDFFLLQKVISRINDISWEKLSPDHLSKEIDEMFYLKNEDGDTVLHAAMGAEKDYLKCLLQVLDKSQNKDLINCVNSRNETPLHLAVLYNQPEFIKMLLNKGADVNCLNCDGNTAVHMAIRHKHNECLTELLNNDNYTSNVNKLECDKANFEGQTPLHLGAMTKNLFAIKKLVLNGANVNEIDTTLGRHALIIAVQEGHREIVEFLVNETNVDVNLANYAGHTALHYACVVDDGNVDLCQLLINANADPMKANNEQRSKAAEITFRKLTDVTIKEEVESEDEFHLRIDEDEEEEDEDDDDDEDEDESSKGQTSMDLARDKKEILDILKKSQRYTDSTHQGENANEIEVKEECPSPSQQSTSDNGLFEEETLGKLCVILDSSKTWENMAELLNYSFLVPSIKNATSPSKLLFSYADLHGKVTVHNIRSFLETLNEHEAVEIIDLMLAGQVAKGDGSR